MKEPLWLTGELVETVHANLIRLFGGHFGFLNENRLEAVLARPINRWKYEQDAPERQQDHRSGNGGS